MLPTFLGIGVMRAGTTSLHHLLASHDEVSMPTRRKELHYFNRNYGRGLEWYESWFPPTSAMAVGEISPHYLYGPEVVERVVALGTVDRVILSLRDPAARAASHYRFRCRIDNYRGTFEDFLTAAPEAVEWGHYAAPLRHWLQHFDRSQVLILVHEESVASPDRQREALAAHLGIDPGRFGSATGRRNESYVPRHPRVHAAGVSTARWLRRHDADRVIDLARQSRAWQAIGTRRAREDVIPIDPEILRSLREQYAPGVLELAELTDLDLRIWPSHPAHADEDG